MRPPLPSSSTGTTVADFLLSAAGFLMHSAVSSAGKSMLRSTGSYAAASDVLFGKIFSE